MASGGEEKKFRLTSLDRLHYKIVGTCFVYQITLVDRFDISSVRTLLGRNPRLPATTSLSTSTLSPTRTLEASFDLLENGK